MKISLAAHKLCRAFGWLVCAALTPVFAQTDDHGNTAATATTIANNSSTAGVLSPGGDVDYFRFVLPYAAHVVTYTTGAIDTSGSLRDASDVELASNDDGGTFPNFRIERDLPAGTYFIRVSGAGANVTGPYTLQLEIDDGNTLATATDAALNSTLQSSINPVSDVDYFRITLAADARVAFYTTGSTNTSGSLRNFSDVEIASNGDASVTDTNFRIERDMLAGTYYMRITASGTGSYVFHVETVGTAVVTTATPTGIFETGATLGGTVVSDAGAAVTERGVVYGTTTGPLKGVSPALTVTAGSGTGSFSANVVLLSPGTHYFARAYAVNSTGASYGSEVEFTTLGSAPVGTVDDHGDTLGTATPVAINSTTKGIIHSSVDGDFFRVDLPAPGDLFVITTGTTDTAGRLIDSTGQLIAFNDNDGTNINFRIDQSLPAGTYYILVTGNNAIGAYTLVVQTTIRPLIPTVSTAAATSIASASAVLGGAVTNEGGATITQRGVVYSTTPNPTLNDGTSTTVLMGTGGGTFTASATGLRLDTHYYVRAFAVNSAGVGYGDALEFTTNDDYGNTAATATAAAVNANVNGSLSSAGDVDYFRFVLTEPRFVAVFTTGSTDTVGSLRGSDDAEIAGADGGGAGANFRIQRQLAAGTYYVRVAGAGSTTGSYVLRIETSTLATVTTGPVTDLAPFNVMVGGNVTSDGGTPVTQRGIVFGPQSNPTLGSASTVANGEGAGAFTARLNVSDGVTYFARAFAVNTAGVAYGNEVMIVTPSGTRLSNLSIRGRAGEGDQALLVGFTLGGTGNKQLLLRGIGPTLGTFGVTGALPDPFLQLFSPKTAIASNEDWGGAAPIVAASASVGAFPLPAASKDAVMLQTLSEGSYTMRVGGGTGAALAEIYDVGLFWTPELTNVSSRAQIGTGADTLIAGFTITGGGTRTVLIRAVGPSLAPFGVSGVAADPKLDVYRAGAAAPISSNDNWDGAAALALAFTRVGAFALPPGSRDSALLLTLPAGSYTAQVTGVGNTTGVVLLEIYQLP
jgi:hypothetical protein